MSTSPYNESWSTVRGDSSVQVGEPGELAPSSLRSAQDPALLSSVPASVSAARPVVPVASRPALRLASVVTVQDVLMLGYLVTVRVLLGRSEPSAIQATCAHYLEACLALLVSGVLFARVIPGIPARVRDFGYKLTLAGLLIANYLMLRDVMPVIRPDTVDEPLYQLDLRLFGVEPAVWLQRLNTRPVVEWFSFFYFSYFAICALYMVTVGFILKTGRRTTEFAIGTFIVYCGGQLGYMAVPGFGPYVHLASQYTAPIDGGFWWSCVWDTVQAGSAMKDIFPSLHTAGPTWFTLFAWQQSRTDARWKWPARVTGFFAANIIFSTMFLRWHYAVDVIAGLVLSVSVGLFLAPTIARVEEAFRARKGWSGVWSAPGSGPAPSSREGARAGGATVS